MWMLLWSGLAFAGPPAEFQAGVTGRWVMDEDPAVVEKRVDDAIAASVAQMAFYLRPFAGPRLKEGARVCSSYNMALNDLTWMLRCDDRTPMTRALDNHEGPVLNDNGDEMEVKVAHAGQNLSIEYTSSSGRRKSAFAFAGETVTLKAEVHSDYLAEPLTWTVRYRRVQ